MYRYIVLLVLVASFIYASEANTVTLDKGCGAPTCKFGDMLKVIGSTISKSDDVLVNGAKGVVYTISSPITCKSMNITSGKVILNAATDIVGELFLGKDAILEINNNLNLNTNLNCLGKIVLNSGAAVIGKLGCNACSMNIVGGALTLANGIVASADADINFLGGIVKHQGDCVYNAIPKCSGSAIFNAAAGSNVVLNKGISCLDKSTLQALANANVNIKGGKSILLSPISLDTKATCALSGNADATIKGVTGAAGSIFTVVDASALLNGPSTCDILKLDGKALLKAEADINVNSLTATAATTLNACKQAKLNIVKEAKCDSKLNLQDTANLIIANSANAQLHGGLAFIGDSVFNIGNKCNVDIQKDTSFIKPVTVGSASVINLSNGAHTFNGGVNAPKDSTFTFGDKCISQILKDSNFGAVDLTHNSALNINHGSDVVVSGPFNCAKTATTTLTDSTINLKGASNIASNLGVNGNSKVTVDAVTKLLGGCKAGVNSAIDVNGQLHVLAPSDIQAITKVNANGQLNLGGDSCTHNLNTIYTDAKGVFNIAGKSLCNMKGDATLNGVTTLADGSKLIILGEANVKNAINTVGTIPSDIQISKTGVCKLLSDANINGNVIVDIGSQLDISGPGKCNIGNSIQNSGTITIAKPVKFAKAPAGTSGQSQQSSGQSQPSSGQSQPSSGQSHPTSGQSQPSAQQTIDQAKQAAYQFIQNTPTSVCHLVPGGSIDADTINFVKGTVQGAGALTCNTCNLGNRIDANLNIVGNVNVQPTAVLVAQLEKAVGGAAQFAPMIVASGTATLNGAVDVVCSADIAAAIKSGAVYKIIAATKVNGKVNLNAAATANASAAAAAAASKAWSLVGPSQCGCDYSLKRN